MSLTGRVSFRPIVWGHILVVRVEDSETGWRDANHDDLADLGCALKLVLPQPDITLVRAKQG